MPPSKPLSRSARILLALALVGFADALYLSLKHALGSPIVCAVGNCELVTTSVYSRILGVPVAYLGVLYYLSILAVVFVRVRLAAKLTAGGFLASLWFLFAQVALLRALCLFCLVSALVSILLFATGMYALVREDESLD